MLFPFKSILLVGILVLTTWCNIAQVMDKGKIQQIRQQMDNINHLIFFSESMYEELKDKLSIFETLDHVKIYINDCVNNELSECQNIAQFPLLLLYNRILIRFNGNPSDPQDIFEWIHQRIQKMPHFVNNYQQLENLSSKYPDLFCYCYNPKSHDERGAFYALGKALIFPQYCLIDNLELIENLTLKPGNITHIKSSPLIREEFQHQNRYEAWQWFLKSHFISKIKRTQELVSQRFTQKEKNVSVVALVCDLSKKCEEALKTVQANQQSFISQNNNSVEFRLAIQDAKESFLFNLYYHLTFNISRLPALIYVELISNSQRSGDIARYVQYLPNSQINTNVVKNFLERVAKREIQKFYFSAEIPKKDGFQGKGSQKLIQKLVARTINKTIQSSKNHYVVLITAINIGCKECDSFYFEYKQVASFLKEKDVTFGLININQNQIDIQKVQNLPDVLLFKKDDKQNPIRFNVRHSFDNFILFFKNNLGESYITDQL